MLDLSSEAEHTVPFRNHAKSRKLYPHHSPDTAMLRKARMRPEHNMHKQREPE